jgi:hypothetical protein
MSWQNSIWKLGALQRRIHMKIFQGFGWWGEIVSTYPYHILISTLVLAAALSAGLIRGQSLVADDVWKYW